MKGTHIGGWGYGGQPPASGSPPARSRAPLLGNNPLTQVAAPEPRGERAHAGTQGRPDGPDVRPTPPLSACQTRREAEPRPPRGGGQPAEPTNQRVRHIPRPGAGQPIGARV